jgi:glycolate oxidase iron-sulfur subunit
LKVAFFVGCLIDKLYPQVADAVRTSLEYHGVGLLVPPEQGCCGIPALAGGDTETFNTLVHHNLARFAGEPFDYLVTACATCSSTLKKLWPMLTQDFPAAEQERITALAAKTLDISQFLVDKVGLAPETPTEAAAPIRLTYHDPCHLKKSLGVAAQPRSLLRANPRYNLQEMAEADWCCGMGGSFNLQHYEISAAIGRRKRDHIIKSGCQVVATGCPACMLQITDMLSQAKAGVQVKHAVEIYAEGLKKSPQ